MEKEYVVNGFAIKVSMEEGIIHIVNDAQLCDMLNDDRLINSTSLVQQVTDDYKTGLSRPLAITADSLIVEIW